MHGTPDDHDSPSALVEALLSVHAEWLFDRCAKAAAGHPGLDSQDVYQATLERLLRASVRVDPRNAGLRTFLGQRVDWVVSDLARQRLRHGGVDVTPEEYENAAQGTPNGGSDAPERHEPDEVDLLAEVFAAAGLTESQTTVMQNECGEPGVPAKEFAEVISRTYAAIRKDKQRALERLRRWLGLSEQEVAVFEAVHRHGRISTAAAQLGMAEPVVRALHTRAKLTITHKINGRRGDADVH